MDFYLILGLFIVLVGLLIYFNNRMYDLIKKELRKLVGDSQQIKTAQRADKKRDHKMLTMITPKKRGRPKKVNFDF